MYTVKIKRKHIEHTSARGVSNPQYWALLGQYRNRIDCPLYRAIKEQLQGFPLKEVAENGGIIDKYDVLHTGSNTTPWNFNVALEFINSGQAEYEYSFN